MDLAVSVDYKEKIKESERIDKYLELVKELKKTLKCYGDVDTDRSSCTWNDTKMFGKKDWRNGKSKEKSTPSRL